jgi:hypothetical protein
LLEDIAILTGGKAIMEETRIKLEGVRLEDLATIVDGAAIEGRIKQLRAQIEETTSDYAAANRWCLMLYPRSGRTVTDQRGPNPNQRSSSDPFPEVDLRFGEFRLCTRVGPRPW